MNRSTSVLNTTKAGIQAILNRVEKPSRYLGSEINRVHKNWDEVQLHVALAFPDLYEIGTSHFGIQILYHILNQRPEIVAEQVFAPGQDLAALLGQEGYPLGTLESGTALNQFDLIGFSLLYELNYTNVLYMLDLGGIPLRSAARGENDPFIIAGGPCVCNPEPMADFFDAMVFGDGEEVVVKMADAWLDWGKSRGRRKNDLLREWSGITGVYIPGFFEAAWDEQGFQHLSPKFHDYKKVRRAVAADLDGAGFPDQPVVPFGRPVHDRLRLEVSRGCSRGCRFCQAGMIYRPVRERSPSRLIALFDRSLETTGFEDVSLLSLSTGDYTCLAPLMENLMDRSRKAKVALSLPSVRAGSLTPGLMQLIRSVRKTGFTIAPEAGSQRLRDVINKNITYEDVASTIEDAFALGWQVIKLYFMVGLPTETRQDLDALVEMVKALKKIKGPKKRRGKINVSLTTFVPKPHTPFQWASQISMEASKEVTDDLRQRLRSGGLQIKWQDKGMSLLEGVMARGDRRLSEVIEKAWQMGCRFDGWNDAFDLERWLAAFDACGMDLHFFTSRRRSLDEPLPWDLMDSGVRKSFLQEQWQAALDLEKVEDCRYGACHHCGVCDFKQIKPVVFQQCPSQPSMAELGKDSVERPESYTWREVVYSKLGPGRFFAHLEQAHIFARALRRARIDVAFSQGFHPMPRISFDNPLPLGMESEGEKMRILVLASIRCHQVQQGLNQHLPKGLRVESCRLVDTRKMAPCTCDRYQIMTNGDPFDSKTVEAFQHASQWPHSYDKKGLSEDRTLDLKKVVRNLSLQWDGTLHMELCRQGNRIIRPGEVLDGILGLTPEAVKKCRVLKLATSEKEK